MIVPFVSLLFGLVEPIFEKPQWSFSTDAVLGLLSYYITYFENTYGILYALLFISAIFIFCSLVSNLFRFLGMFYLSPVSANAVKDLRNSLYNKILHLPLSYFSNIKTGDILTRFNTDLIDIDTYLIRVTVDVFLRQPLMILFFMIALLMISPWLTLLSVVTFPLIVFLTRKISLSIKRKSTQGQEQLSSISSIYEESISGVRIIKAFLAQKWFKNKFEQHNKKYTRLITKVIRYIELSPPLSELLAILGLVLVILLGCLLMLNNNGLTAEAIILFLILFARLISPIQTCIRGYGYIQKGLVSAARVLSILDSDNRIEEKQNALKINQLQDKIIFNNVSFSYNSEREVLHNINFEIKKGETVAIVGNSGGGKSTLVNLLLRLYDVVNGNILIDGIDIKEYCLKDVRRLFGVVNQDVLLFNDTVEANIKLWSDNIPFEEVEKAAKMACADEFISQMPQKYATIIGDRGVNLSGGQRQRLSIARAAVSKPTVFLLDEATSSLDSQSEQLVERALSALMQQSTCLVIAHRLSTVKNADKIIVLNEGKIVEQGTYSQLLATNGLFKKMLELQTDFK
jgi:subfamily B ATP-binding cassette protein MsbA